MIELTQGREVGREAGMYIVSGHYVGNTLGKRLNDTRITGISSLPGVLVYTPKGVFYSEVRKYGEDTPIQRESMGEAVQGLVELATKEHVQLSNDKTFSVRKNIRATA